MKDKRGEIEVASTQRNQHAGARREPARHRRDREQHRADEKGALVTDPVGELGRFFEVMSDEDDGVV